MANLSLATNKKFKEEEKTTWHKVVVFDPRIADTMGKYAKKVLCYMLKARLKLDLIKMLMTIKDM